MDKMPFLRPEDARSIVVFRALMLGDVLCATPALRALRAGFPHARITLVGLPWARSLIQRLPSVDEFIAFPGHPALPESRGGPQNALPDFLAAMQSRRFDLALQMHGNGSVTNTLVAAFGARRTAAFHRKGAYRPDPAMGVPWPEGCHEIERCLALTDRLGLERDGLQLELPLATRERAAARRLAAGNAPYVVLHPGSQWPSRRWPVERFAAVGDALAQRGYNVLITGSETEAPLTRALREAMLQPSLELAGRTDVWELAALVEHARLVVCNDTGVSHVATATRTPSVVVACGSDVTRWAPLDTARHRVLWQAMPCRPCAHPHCPTAHECALAIGPDTVIATALQLLETPAVRWPSDYASSPGMFTATTCIA